MDDRQGWRVHENKRDEVWGRELWILRKEVIDWG
jgi:hypothetical protein